jgi:hypothetical protein
MKAVLKFDMTDYDDKLEFEIAVNGKNFLATLWELDQYLRGRLKYEDLPEIVYKALEETREHLHEELSHNGASLDLYR